MKNIFNKITRFFYVFRRIKNKWVVSQNELKGSLELLEYKIDNLNKNLLKEGVLDINNMVTSFTLLDYQINSIIDTYSCKYKSYSQYKEDLVIKYVFDKLDIKNPSYIDIGAHDPLFLSNTALLYETGGRGINIEPNAVFYNKFKVARHDDENMNCGVGRNEGVFDYYNVVGHPALNTFSLEQVEKLKFSNKKLKIDKTVVEVKNLNHIMQDLDSKPDFMSIDVEGLDFDILNDLKDDFFPKLICVEINNHGIGGRIVNIDRLLFNKGYFIIASIGGNSLFLKKEFLFRFMDGNNINI